MHPLYAFKNGMGLIPVTMESNPECSLQTIRSRCLSDQSLDWVLLRVLDDNFGLSEGETSDEEGVGISSCHGDSNVDPNTVLLMSRVLALGLYTF